MRLSCSQYTELEAFFWLQIERKSSKKYSVIVFVEKALSKTSCFEARLSSINRKKKTDHTTCSHVLLSHVFTVLFCCANEIRILLWIHFVTILYYLSLFILSSSTPKRKYINELTFFHRQTSNENYAQHAPRTE